MNNVRAVKCQAPATMGGFQYTLWVAAAAAVACVQAPEKAAAYNDLALKAQMIIVALATLFGVVNSAYEGRTLNEQWNALWVPVVVPFAFILTAPVSGGKSAGHLLLEHLLPLLP